MNIRVHLHGPWRDLSEHAMVVVEMKDGAEIHSLRSRLLTTIQQDHPDCNPELMSVSAFAVDESLVGEDFRLSDGMDVHILPPVNGG